MDRKGVNCDKKVVVRASSLSLKSRRYRRTLTRRCYGWFPWRLEWGVMSVR